MKRILFFINLHVLFVFSCFSALSRTSNTVLKISGEREHPCLVANCNGKDSNFSPLSLALVVLIL